RIGLVGPIGEQAENEEAGQDHERGDLDPGAGHQPLAFARRLLGLRMAPPGHSSTRQSPLFTTSMGAEHRPSDSAHRTLILGGGIAGLEALLAIRDLAADRTQVTLVAAEPEFTYKPLIVEEPFTYQPAERHELEPAVSELGARFVRGVAGAVRPDAHAVVLTEGEGYDFGYTRELAYDLLVLFGGGRSRAPYKRAVTFRFRSIGDPLEVDDLLARAEAHESRTLAFVVPPGVTWSLPLYELPPPPRPPPGHAGP